MDIPRQLRNIAKSQLEALKDRLDKIEIDSLDDSAQRSYRRAAEAELREPGGETVVRRTPEEISSGRLGTPAVSPEAPGQIGVSRVPIDPLVVHYAILGVEPGSDLSSVDAAYSKLVERCNAERFPDGSDEQREAKAIFKRVDGAYGALRDALDPTAGRFDKLEL